jgi:tRNA modification GTPase
MSQDTIFALASGVGRSAVAIIRLSGPQVKTCLTGLIGMVPPPRSAVLKQLRSDDGPIDQALVLYFPGPHSFTGEDIAEFQVHGSPAVVSCLLSALSRLPDCRLAEAGEFSRRALSNGKMDLAHIEGLIDLIDSETQMQRKQALRQMQGYLSDTIAAWRRSLLQVMALVESQIDFSDEEDVSSVDLQQIVTRIQDLIASLQQALAQSDQGIRLREGLVIIVAGPPNAGKSSLVNYLAKKDVAIVSPIAGTTRDLIEVPLQLDGFPLTLIDTAGLRESHDPIEQEGVKRALSRAQQADLGLWLTAPDQHEDPPAGPDWILVRTKADLLPYADPDHLSLSLHTGVGLDDLLQRLKAEAARRFGSGDALVTRERQRQAIDAAVLSLFRALDRLKDGSSLELAAEDLRLAGRCLGSVIGVVGVEAMLDSLFAEFCIGK